MRRLKLKDLLLLAFFFASTLAYSIGAQAAETVTVSIEKFTIGQGYIVEPTIVSLSKGDTAAKVIDHVLNMNGYKYTHRGTFTDTFYLEQIKNSDNGHYVVPSCIRNMGAFVTSDQSSIAPPTGDEINEAFPDLTEHSYMPTSGWMYTVAGKDVSQLALSDYYPEDGDIIRFQFTLYGYGADLGLVYDNEEFPLKLPDRNEITRRLALINQNKAKLLSNAKYRNAYDTAMDIVISMNTSKKSMEDALAALPLEKEIEDYLVSYNKNAVQSVIDNIESIDVVSDTSQKTLINATKEAYDILTDEQRIQVGDERKNKLDVAVAALRECQDKEDAEQLTDMIKAIGFVTLDKESQIQIVENMYKALSDGALTKLEDNTKILLQNITAEIDKLKNEKKQNVDEANSVARRIYAIGAVTLTKADRIKAIRKDYDLLSQGAKDIIPDSIYKILTDAESELAVLEKKDAEEKAANAKQQAEKAAAAAKQEAEKKAAAEKQAADKKSADNVTARINALGTVTLDKESAVVSARKAYNALNANAKKQVTSEILSKLTAAEQTLVSLKKEQALKKKYTPAKVVLKTPKPAKKQVKLTWKKIKTASGYQIFMSAKKASGYKKITTIKKAKTITYTKKKLKSKKVYYFRIRAYRKVGKATYYGAYSTVKKVKIK